MRKKIVGSEWLPRCSVPIVFGLVMNLVMGFFLVLYYFDLLPYAHGAERTVPPAAQENSLVGPNLAGLNVRLSTRPIHPPTDQVKRMVLLQEVRTVKPLVGEPTRAAILEDDARRRVVVLSTESDSPGGAIRAYVLYDVDLERYLPLLATCSGERRCAQDRTPGTGGLGCVAICLAELLRR
jgi:hypothetical protein